MTYEERRAIIEQLMDHWEDFILPSVGVAPAGGSEGVGILFASAMGNYPSVVELNRCLEVIRAKVPNHFKHLRGWYSSEWRIVEKPMKIRNPRGKMVWASPTPRFRERVVPSWVTWRIVDRSLDMVVALWNSGVVLELPPGLTKKLREMTDADGTHLTEAA